jgi:uncharacterized protein (DUF3084 family)
LSASNEDEINRRTQDLQTRELQLAERKRALLEKKQLLATRKRKMDSEFKEISQRERETVAEYESAKQEILTDIDKRQIEAQNNHRSIRNRTIELDVEIKRVLAQVDKI